MKKIKEFYVIREEYGKFIPYDVMWYFYNCYKKEKKDKRPKTFKECKKFLEKNSIYLFWSKCEYEMILTDCPCQQHSEKWDIHKQIMMNIDLITEIFMNNKIKK